MLDRSDHVKEAIDAIALDIVTMDGDDIPVLGVILNRLVELEEAGSAYEQPDFNALLCGLKAYLEKIILREASDLEPFERGLRALQAVQHCIRNQQNYKEDISAILKELGLEPVDVDCMEPPARDHETYSTISSDIAEEQAVTAVEMETEKFEAPDSKLDDEDLEILSGFVMESLEGLETIEVSLIDIEQDPEDAESINAIFRSFHTIKGVSGFLNLMRINKLAHRAENLLEKVRAGEIAIDETIVDIILESVDLIKQLVQGVGDGMQNNTPLDIGLDIGPLVQRIEAIQADEDRDDPKPIGEILVRKGALSPEALEKGLVKQRLEPEKKLGKILIDEQSVAPSQVRSALRDQKKLSRRQADLQVKVDTKKLDNLVDLTGELVIAQTMLRQNLAALSSGDQKLGNTLGQLNQITSSLQTTAMSMRMVPIKSTFQKMRRLVRDLAKNTGKQVRLKMSGEDTEIDRNVVEELYEPMVHMIRNSVDHGIEAPEERRGVGKAPNGKVHLLAYHRGGNIIVEIQDDGRGLNKERILEKAKAGGLISDETSLSDAEIFNLIFQPGFSTAEKVTDVSGRGVGMDVVKKAIEKLKGRVEINSRPGCGSTFVISLPLTLAIVEGMLVRVGWERYVIPALSIKESFRPCKENCSTVKGRGEMILSRGQLVPLVRLNRILDVKSDTVDPWQALVVVVEYEDHQMGLLLDELLGKEEVVIKSLGETFKNVDGIAGGAIMGDGRVGLILDMAGIWKIVKS